MIVRTLCASLLLLFASTAAFAQAPAPDACEAILPAALKAALPRKFPGYRLAHVSDYAKEDVDQHIKDHDGNPCLGVASADVEGDGFTDFAFFLTDKTKRTILVAARNVSAKTWQISRLYDFGKKGSGGSYVEIQDPGSYQDLFDTDSAPSEYTPEPGRVRRYKSSHPGFIAGAIESSGAAFFFTGKRWVHLWLLD